MGEKFYKPIVKDGDHLIRSKDNPDRVRGLTRDENNQNPDIPEWEEYDLDDLKQDPEESTTYKDQEIELTPEQQQMIQEISKNLIIAITTGVGIILFQKVIYPWWENSAWPWIKNTTKGINGSLFGSKNKDTQAQNICTVATTVQKDQPYELSEQIDRVFEQFYFEMNEDETKEHLMRLIYHILGVVNEIRIISNSEICKDSDSEELRIERQKEVEKYLSQLVTIKLNKLLSNEDRHLDLNTSRELFSLTGGGVRLNGEYIPVQESKINEAMKAIKIKEDAKK